ncbi:MAG: phasin family protein [Alphaproteobacteria bacterium]
MTPEPEPASTTALAQSAPAEAARPAVGAPGVAPFGTSPKAALGATEEDTWTALAEAQSALARGFEQAAFEMTGMSRSGMAATADAAVALLGARTLAEAIEINAGLARRGVDAMLEGAARLSEIGAQAAADASRPLIARFARNWSALGGG